MSIPKRGSRIVTLGEQRYRWHVRRKPTYSQGIAHGPMRVAIESLQATARKILLIDLKVTRPDNWVNPHQTALTPAVLRDIIKQALIDGWNPTALGAPFQMEYGLIQDRP